MGQITYPDRYFVNSDIKTMAVSLIDDANKILDEDPAASRRRIKLLRASSHLLNAFVELEELGG